MNTIQEPTSRGRRFPLGLFIAAFAVSNFIAPSVFDSLGFSIGECVLGGTLFGVIAAQFGLLIIWAVLGPGKAAARQAFTMLLAVFLLSSLVAGTAVTDPPSSVLREMGPFFLFLPLVFLIAQLPLWGMKLMTGGRIVHVDKMAGQSPTEGRQFGLRQVIGTTLLVAVALSLASSGLRISGGDDVEAWGKLLVVGLVSALWSPFVTRPCIWAALHAKKKGPAALAVGIYTALMSLLLLGVLGLFSGWSVDHDNAVILLSFHASLMAVILGTLHVARLCGYSFIRWRRPQPIIKTDCPFALQDDPSEGDQAAGPPAPRADEPPDSAGPSA